MIGRNVGDYRVLAKFDLGESGPVYKAVHITQRQTYLLKLLHGPLDRAIPAHHDFIETVQMACYLDHPNIARTLPLEFYEDITVIPLEFVYGLELSEKISEGRTPVETVLKMAIQGAEALQTAHNVGLTHGKLTSNNVLLTQDGEVKILEFGLAGLQEDMLFRGVEETPYPLLPVPSRRPPLSRFAYQAPEQLNGDHAGPSADLFAFGVMLYEMLAGEFLFLGDDVGELYRQIRQRELPRIEQVRPEVSRSLGEIVTTLVQKDPARRYYSAEFLLEDLRKIRGGRTVERLSFQPKDPALSRRSFFRRFVKDSDH
ncbi:MAG: serine/threonine-protein kinase [Terriglobia bacterium]